MDDNTTMIAGTFAPAVVAPKPPRTRNAPWLGIGVSGEWDDYRDALKAAELDFHVVQRQLFYEAERSLSSTGVPVSYNEPAPMFANVRSNDGKLLGCVTPQYHVVQNEDAFKILEPFLAAGGIITHAGMTEQGLVFMVASLGMNTIMGDEFEFDIMCCNSFNARFPLSVIMTPMRIVCQNMYRKLMGNGDCLLRVRHMSKAPERLAMASKAVSSIGTYMSAFDATCHEAASHSLPPATLEHLVNMLFPYPKPGGEREMTSRERVDYLRGVFMDEYYDASDNVKYHGTGMGFINAYFDFLSHRDPGKLMPGSWDDRKLSQLVSGDVVKTKLIQEALR